MKITQKDGKIVALRQAIKSMSVDVGQVGWFESARTEDGKPVAGIAIVQEFGSTKRSIPPRSFMRSTASEKQTEWAGTAENVARQVMQGKVAPENMTEALCLKAEGDVRAKISSITEPPLSLLTLLARKDRKDFGKRQKKAMKFGPQQEYKFGGKRLGELARTIGGDEPPDVSGVSTKPLVDTGYMLATLTSQVIKK